MRKTLTVFLTLFLLVSLAVPCGAAENYVVDDATLLTPEQRLELEGYARQISERYGIGIYILTVDNFHSYGEEYEIFDVLWNYYHDHQLGYGPERQGMILMLSMAERDFATFFYGEDTEYAFNSFGQERLESYFLDNFGHNDWYGGFRDYLAAGMEFMAKAAEGKPVRESPMVLTMFFVFAALAISFIITKIQWMKMGNVASQKGAGRYQTGNLVLTHSKDHFLNRTVTRRRIQSTTTRSGGGGSVSRSGGGGSGRSGKF